MPTVDKKAAVVGFIEDLSEWKAKVKADAALLLAKLPPAALTDVGMLSDYLFELAEAVITKHLITTNGRISKEAAAMIRRYVEGMTGKKLVSKRAGKVAKDG